MLIDNLYKLESFSAHQESANATITLNPDHEIFEGHFPGKPVLPGVCQIQMIKELLEKTLGKTVFLSEAGSCKFLQVIDPGRCNMLTLVINYHLSDNKAQCNAIIKNEDHVFLKMSALFIV